ncbi:putative Flippase-like domain-containing protein [Candidatus Magnetomoraceae bacterium gMMP-1]
MTSFDNKINNIKNCIIKYKHYISMVLIIAIFYFLLSSIYTNWYLIKNFKWQFNYFFLTCSFMVLMIRHFLMAYIWQKILMNLCVEIDFWQSFRVWYLALGGRYLPGRIWYAMGILYLSAEIGIPKKKVLLGGSFNLGISLISAFLVGLAVLPSYISWEMTGYEQVLFAILAVLIFSLVLSITNKVIIFLSKTKDTLNDIPVTKFSDWLYPFMLYIISWILYGQGLYLLLLSLTPVELTQLLQIISSYAISHTVGFLSFITPAGLAVREGTLSVLLSNLFHLFPLYIASAVAILCRILFTLAELTSFLIAIGTNKYLKK